MNIRRVVTFAFENHVLHVFDLDGDIAFLCNEVGAALGYAKAGHRLTCRVLGELRKDLSSPLDYRVLEALGLANLKILLARAPMPPDLKGRDAVLVLFEAGLRKVLARTEQAAAARMRHFLDNEVVPTMRRVAKEPEPTVVPRPVYAPPPSTRMLRELRLLRRVDLDDRRFRTASLRDAGRALHEQGIIDAESLARCEVAGAEIALDRTLLGLRAALFRSFAGSGWTMRDRS